jgi:hypothetical protein
MFFHLLGALLFVAGIVLAGTAFEAARRRARPSEIALLLGLTRIGVLLVAVGGLLLPIFGLWLVHLGHFGFGSGWVDAAIGLYIIVLVLGGLGGQRPKAGPPARDQARRRTGAGERGAARTARRPPLARGELCLAAGGARDSRANGVQALSGRRIAQVDERAVGARDADLLVDAQTLMDPGAGVPVWHARHEQRDQAVRARCVGDRVRPRRDCVVAVLEQHVLAREVIQRSGSRLQPQLDDRRSAPLGVKDAIRLLDAGPAGYPE